VIDKKDYLQIIEAIRPSSFCGTVELQQRKENCNKFELPFK